MVDPSILGGTVTATGSEVPALIAGEAVFTDEYTTVHSPYDGSPLASVARCGTEHIDAAVATGRRLLDQGPLPAHERAAILDRAARGLEEQHEAFARLLSAEACKPIGAARAEVSRAIDTIRFSAAAARDLRGEMVAMDASGAGSGRLGFTLRIPIGVVACISPFNFPLNLVSHKVAPGIAAGVPLVLKPASATPLSALALARLLADCGLPPGWLNVVTTPGSTAQHLVEHPDVAMITFTGSAEVGWALRRAAPRKKVGLELGNSSPVIVAADADLALAAERIVAGGFGYSGQTCISVQRVYAHDSIRAELLERVATLVDGLAVGDPAADDTVVSSLIDAAAAERVHDWITEALDRGARLVCGEQPRVGAASGEPPLNLVAPTVLDDVTEDMRVSCDEVFGPVIGFRGFAALTDAIAAANGTRYGLQAGIFTRDITTALTAARQLEFGGVIINDTSSYRTDQMPYGGVKDSGNTREGPRHAVAEMTEPRTIVIAG